MGFNPRPRARGDFMVSVKPHGAKFQSTPPREGRLLVGGSAYDHREFQSTPPREGRPDFERNVDKAAKFQSTPPREGRLRIQKVAEY